MGTASVKTIAIHGGSAKDLVNAAFGPPKRKGPRNREGLFNSVGRGSPRRPDHNPVVTSIVLPSSRVT